MTESINEMMTKVGRNLKKYILVYQSLASCSILLYYIAVEVGRLSPL